MKKQICILWWLILHANVTLCSEIAESQQRTCSETAGVGEGRTEEEKGDENVLFSVSAVSFCFSCLISH